VLGPQERCDVGDGLAILQDRAQDCFLGLAAMRRLRRIEIVLL